MNGLSLLVLASLGVTYSWRTGVDQQQEYVLQIEPEIVQALLSGGPTGLGEEIFSDLPSDAGPFQRLCIMVQAKDGVAVRHSAAGEEQFRQFMVTAGRYASRDRTLVVPDPLPTLLWPGRAGMGPEQTYGVTTGWQPDKNGNQQYLVQIDPTVLSTLTLGDELYVPIDPAAGRLVRFVVKSGRENLPRVGGTQAASQLPGSLPQSPAGKTGRNRYSSVNEVGTNWSGAATPDSSRQPTRFNGGVNDPAYNDGRGAAYGAPTGASLAPTGNGPYGPPTAYGNSVASVPPPPTYPNYNTPANTPGNNFDQYRGSLAVGGEPLAPSGYGVQPAAGQQPQLPGNQRPLNPQYPEMRVAALPPTQGNAATPGQFSPGVLSPSDTLTRQAAEKPWGPLLFVTFALFFSIGGNLYLAWTALDFHSRYRSAIERLRSAARSA